MKKCAMSLLTLCLLISLAGCSRDDGILKNFLVDTEGDWYEFGNSNSQMLRIAKDGAWTLYEAEKFEGERLIEDSGGAGSISYDSEYKEWNFKSENYEHSIYLCDKTEDGLLIFDLVTFVAANESRDLGERFNGTWYLDGDDDQDYFEFEDGMWDYYAAIGTGHSSSDSGYLAYRGGNTKELTAFASHTDDLFAVFSVVGNDEISMKDGTLTYLRVEIDASEGGDELEQVAGLTSDENVSISLWSFYYLDGESDAGSLFFYTDNTVDFDLADETWEGSYSIDGNILTITWESGEEISLTILDNGSTIVDAQGESFYLDE